MTEQAQKFPSPLRRRSAGLIRALLDVVFPPVCASCGKVGELFCETCYAGVGILDEGICPGCGHFLPSSGLCACSQPSPLHHLRAAARYSPPISNLIHKLKYNFQHALAEPLGDLMVQTWGTWWQDKIDLVAPIPLHPSREKSRGYNQSELLANRFAQQTGLTCLPNAVRRVRNTTPQVGLDASMRATNVAHAFWGDKIIVEGAHVLLIDDVYTTGSTMRAAGIALLAAGARAVSGYCMARAIDDGVA